MSSIVLVHGAWSAAWAWRDFRALLTCGGETVFTPTLTGLGERRHLLTPKIELEDHIQDICEGLFMEDLQDVVLVGPRPELVVRYSHRGPTKSGKPRRVPLLPQPLRPWPVSQAWPAGWLGFAAHWTVHWPPPVAPPPLPSPPLSRGATRAPPDRLRSHRGC